VEQKPPRWGFRKKWSKNLPGEVLEKRCRKNIPGEVLEKRCRKNIPGEFWLFGKEK